MTVDKHGNTSAASIPLALDYAVNKGMVKKDHLIIFEAFGAGFTWGSTLLKFEMSDNLVNCNKCKRIKSNFHELRKLYPNYHNRPVSGRGNIKSELCILD